jgi:dTDP-4-amino-4,6-dideoxygalactose transaminase
MAVVHRKIRYACPADVWSDDLESRLMASVRSGMLTNFGPADIRLQELIENHTGRPACCTSSGTTALAIAIRWAIEKTGRVAVAVPAYTFSAVPQAVRMAGGEIIWYDIDPTTLMPDWQSIDKSQLDELAAFTLCLLYGFSYRDLESVVERHRPKCPLIIDSAHFFGARAEQRSAFALGDAHAISFSAAKIVGGAEGGALVGCSDAIEFCRLARNYGGSSGVALGWGLNGKLSELNSHLVISAIGRLAASREKRIALALLYKGLLSRVPHIEIPRNEFEELSLKETPLIVSNTIEPFRDEIVERMKSLGIEARKYFSPPVYRHPSFSEIVRGGVFQGADNLASRILCLPLSERMQIDDVEYVTEMIRLVIGDVIKDNSLLSS